MINLGCKEGNTQHTFPLQHTFSCELNDTYSATSWLMLNAWRLFDNLQCAVCFYEVGPTIVRYTETQVDRKRRVPLLDRHNTFESFYLTHKHIRNRHTRCLYKRLVIIHLRNWLFSELTLRSWRRYIGSSQ